MRMILRVLLSMWLTTLPALAEPTAPRDYSGFWKLDCEHSFGMKIERDNESTFLIRFCGPGGCTGGNAWLPRSPIEGDPKYKIVSDTQIGVRRADDPNGYMVYRRCSRDPASGQPRAVAALDAGR